MLFQIVSFLLDVIAGLLGGACLLRLYMQYQHIPFANPVGRFVFALTDHAQNGFYHATEWIPVASSAFAVSFLAVPFFTAVNRTYLAVCAGVMLLQAGVGLLGFYLHVAADLGRRCSWDEALGAELRDLRTLVGAP